MIRGKIGVGSPWRACRCPGTQRRRDECRDLRVGPWLLVVLLTVKELDGTVVTFVSIRKWEGESGGHETSQTTSAALTKPAHARFGPPSSSSPYPTLFLLSLLRSRTESKRARRRGRASDGQRRPASAWVGGSLPLGLCWTVPAVKKRYSSQAPQRSDVCNNASAHAHQQSALAQQDPKSFCCTARLTVIFQDQRRETRAEQNALVIGANYRLQSSSCAQPCGDDPSGAKRRPASLKSSLSKLLHSWSWADP